MDLVRHFSEHPVERLQEYLKENAENVPWQNSELYSSERDAKFVDTDLRQSQFQVFQDPELFELLEASVVKQLNDSDSTYHYMIHKNDVTHIKYTKGGFFKKHRDYLSTTSNLVEEYTLLVCVTPSTSTPDAKGGDTKIFTYGTEKTFDTHTAGCGLLFCKDLEHEGTEVLEGEKHILTANIWATRKDQTDQVLLVTFPENGDSNTEATIDNTAQEQETEAGKAIERAACRKTTYVIPVYLLRGMLKAHVDFCNRQAGESPSPVVEYRCKNFDFDTFGTIERILKRSYVGEVEIVEQHEVIDYFGPFLTENLLVELAVQPKTEEEEEDPAPPPSKRQQIESDPPFDPTVIVCENEARTKVVLAVTEHYSEPYVPFQMLFVEGVLATGDEIDVSIVEVPMICTACVVGDYNNLFTYTSIATSSEIPRTSLMDMNRNSNAWSSIYEDTEELKLPKPGAPATDMFETDTLDNWYEICEESNSMSCALQVGFGHQPQNLKQKITNMVFENKIGKFSDLYDGNSLFHNPGWVVEGDGNGEDAEDDGESLFHRDENGLVVFSRQEAKRASDYLAELELYDRVKASLQQTKFDLPQKMSHIDYHFCNESVYGNVNILWVTGAVRLDPRAEILESSQLAKLKKWPNDMAKAQMEKQRRKIRRQTPGR